MSSQWKPTKLAEVLIPVSRAEAVDPTKEYLLLGVRLEGRGPFLRETVMGSQIAATRLFKVEEGNFIYSRLFAWRGAFGVIEPALDGCYVSGEFPTFKPVPEKIDTEFLRLWFRLPTTIELVEADCTGSTPLTRNRFKENFFLNLEIPLPPLSEQRRIVARIESLAARIEEAQGLKAKITTDERHMLLATFSKLIAIGALQSMEKIAPITRRPIKVEMESTYPELGVRSFGKGTFPKPTVPGIEIGSKKLFCIEPGDLVFNNVFAWEGAVAVAKAEDAGRVGSHRFIACVPKEGIATANFLCFYFLGLRELVWVVSSMFRRSATCTSVS